MGAKAGHATDSLVSQGTMVGVADMMILGGQNAQLGTSAELGSALTDQVMADQQAVTDFTAAQNIEQPATQTSTDALNQLRFYLGMAPVDQTGQLVNDLNSMAQIGAGYQQYGIDFGPLENTFSGLASQLQAADASTDPVFRQNFLNSFTPELANIDATLKESIAPDLAALQQGMIEGLPQTPTMALTQLAGEEASGLEALAMAAAQPPVKDTKKGIAQGAAEANAANAAAVQASQQMQQTSAAFNMEQYEQNALQGWENADSIVNQVQNMLPQYFSATPPQAPTGEQVFQKLQSQPGYVANFLQGQQAVQRQAVSQGFSGSGNAAIALQQFGSNYATQQYQNTIQNYANLAGVTLGSATNTANNLTAAGQAQAGIFGNSAGVNMQAGQQFGNAALSSSQAAGSAILQAAMENAQLATQTSIANAQMQTQASMSNASSFAGIGGSVLGALL